MEGLKNKKKIILSVVGGLVVITAAVIVYKIISRPPPSLPDPLFKYSCVERGNMFAHQFDTFLAKMSDERKVLIMRAVEPDYSASGKDKLKVVNDIRERLIKESSHWVTYQFKDKHTVHYDETVRWVGKKLGIEEKIKTLSTFKAEREIFIKLFVDVWDKMSPEQRNEALKSIKMVKKNNIAGIAALSGSAALAALSGTAAFNGFAFYTGMSSLIYSMASIAGVTLPFATYTGATSIAAVLTGPVGWALIAVGTATGCALIGRANDQETAKMIVQIHLIKVDTIQKSGYDLNKYLAKSQRTKLK